MMKLHVPSYNFKKIYKGNILMTFNFKTKNCGTKIIFSCHGYVRTLESILVP